MRPASFSQGDITEFYVKVKQAIDDFLELLRRDEHMMIAHEHLEIILPQIRMLLAEGIVFDCLPAKLCTNAQIMYTRPESPGLLPTHLAKACGFVTNSDTAIPAVVAHTGNVSFSSTPTPRRDLSPAPRQTRRESRSLTGVTAGRSTGDLHPQPRYDSRDPPDSWTPSKNACFRCLREGHRTRDCRFLMYCPFHRSQGHSWEAATRSRPRAPSQGTRISTRVHITPFFRHSPSPEVRPARTGVYVTSPRQPDDTSPCGAPLLPIRVGSHELLAFLDSGSAVSIIPVSSLSKCKHHPPAHPHRTSSTVPVVRALTSSARSPSPFIFLTCRYHTHSWSLTAPPSRGHPPGLRLHGQDRPPPNPSREPPASDKVTTGPPDTSATTATLSGYTQPKVTPTPGYRNFTPLAATSARTWTPASDSPFCQTSETTVLPPFTDCVVPVTIPDTSGTVLVLPEGIRVHGLLALPAVYDAPDGQFSLRLINTLDSPIRLEHSTRVLDCEVTPLPIRMMDTAAPTFHTSTSPVTVPRSPDASAPSTAHVPDVTAVDFAEGPAILGGLFKEFPLILPSTERPIGRTNILEHSIHLQQDAKPVYIPAYRVPHSRRQAFEDQINKLLEDDHIEPSTSPWSAPMILVPKKDGSLRPVIDYRKLNALTIPDRFPIPSLRSLLQDVGKGHAVFSTLDLQSGFFQVQMDKDSRPLTAFSTPQGHFQFKSMPFGHTVDSNGISPNSAKIEDILRFPTPREVKHVKSFLGLAGFYRPFIKGFAKIADPLSRLLTKDASFAWTAEHQQSFDTLKSLLTRSPVLIFPDFQLPFTLATDASCTGLGAALMQRIDGRLRPIAYASRKLNAAETRYSTDLEALAVVWSLRHFREIILGYDIEVLTDHRPLLLTLRFKVPERTPGTLDRHIAGVNPDPTYGELIGILESDPSAALPRRPHVPTSELYLEGDLLFRRSSPPKQRGTRQRHTYKQLVIPEDLVPTILRLLHEAPTASHAGADKAIKFARERYFFPRMASRITEHIRRCQVCPLHKGSASAPAPALTYDVPDRPFQRVSVDILSGFSTSTSGCRLHD
ncbi:hypothetical protein C7M84_009464 [Penaeus vannamei]|uniref:RNA-directed DNA polymerase n=1 Tax=Penaeus vannamei TaxID=6689 RepID=A0A423T6P0_PENVA|nr:hypothetical protein C7M84_009464 [Penaeus vannamei]